MKRALGLLAVTVILGVGSRPVLAESSPPIQGEVFGLEFCPQSVCGAAIFAGLFNGLVGTNPHAFGTVAVAVNHDDPLPGPGDFAAITGGVWELRASGRRFRGRVAEGTLFNNGNDTFTVTAVLELTRGGTGELFFVGLLDHNVFPPTIAGQISQ